MKRIIDFMWTLNKTMIVTACSFMIMTSFVCADMQNMNMQERCIASWLALSGQLKSVFDQKMVFDDIDAQLYPELAKFVKKHRCPVAIEKLILHQLSLKDRLINHFQNSSYIIIKGATFDRLVNAERMRKCIELNNLNLLSVAQKYLYKDGDSWGVAALQVDTHNRAIKLSLAEAQQIFVLGMETGYRDWKFDCDESEKDNRNFFYDKQGCIVCVDTEDLSFQVTGHYHCWPQYVPHDCKANYAMSMLHYKDTMQPDAAAWVTQKANEILKSPDAFKAVLSLPLNTRYDDPAISIEKVKQEFRKYIQIQQVKIGKNQGVQQPVYC